MRLLLTIFSIAVMSIPGPLRLFDGSPNVWIVTVPFVWLPTMMVMAALLGHLLLLRRLLGARSGTRVARDGSSGQAASVWCKKRPRVANRRGKARAGLWSAQIDERYIFG